MLEVSTSPAPAAEEMRAAIGNAVAETVGAFEVRKRPHDVGHHDLVVLATDLAPGSLALALAAWLGKLLLFAIVVAITESATAKMRLFRVPEFLGMAFLLSLLALTSDTLLR